MDVPQAANGPQEKSEDGGVVGEEPERHHYEAQRSEWDDQFTPIAEGQSGIRRARHDITVTYLDVLIVAAIPVEWEALNEEVDVLPARYISGQRAPWRLRVGWLVVPGTDLRYRIGIASGFGSGGQRTLPALSDLVPRLEPKLVVMCGIAAGNPYSELKIGDVVVSDVIISLDVARIGATSRWKPEDETRTRVNRQLMGYVSDFVERHGGNFFEGVRVGPIVAQPNVVRDRKYRDQLFGMFPDALALEMEGGALAMACDSIETSGSMPLARRAARAMSSSLNRCSGRLHSCPCSMG